ncbi:MAG: right-handed parallel beta-helix repeat-containing protein [Planctomycetes bacterium]|nr:right-handed parallel beta-helix repeat-containing protein [Planctomycetota bacterium]
MLTTARLVCLALFTAPLAAQLSGTYTVNPAWPVFPGNYTSLAAAVTDLMTNGVAGAVTFELYDDAGPFNESHPFVSSNGTWNPSTAALTLGQWPGASSANRVTFRPAAGEAPVIDATGRSMGVFWNGADFVTLEGLEIRNAIYDAISLYSEAQHGVANDPIIRRCRIHDCGSCGITVYGNSSYPLNTLIENNFLWSLQTSNGGAFSTTARFGYVTTRRSTNTRVVHNTFWVDTGTGSYFAAIGAYMSSLNDAPFAEVSNNVIVKLTASARPIFHLLTPTGALQITPTVCDSNCFFDASSGPFAHYGDGGTTIANTLLDWQTTELRDLASLAADPLLADPANHDFHLDPLSPCIGASTLAAGSTDDIDGQPRTTALDIGADEFSAATIVAVGAGCPGTGALVPSMSWLEWPYLGNQDFAVLVRDMPPGQAMLPVASFGASSTPFVIGAGCEVWLDLGSLVVIPVLPTAGPAGTASLVVPFPANAAFVGVDYGFQALVFDPGATLGFTMTNALDVELGF